MSDKLKWPPLKIYVYPKNKYHTDDCLYPPEMPNRYINETNYWFQRMLEPTVHFTRKIQMNQISSSFHTTAECAAVFLTITVKDGEIFHLIIIKVACIFKGTAKLII